MASVSFLELPSIDFSFTVGGLDVMSVGPKEMGVAKIVKTLINSAIRQEALYPKKVMIPLLDDQTQVVDTSLPPQGVLTLTIERANHLKVADLVSSDPYVQIQCLDQTYRTTTKYSTLNPIYNESFDLIIYDKLLQTVEFTVYDK
jgi:Ca2+-dependent lipid-binding protein